MTTEQLDSWEKDLLKERSLTDVFLASRQITKSRFNTIVRRLAAVGVVAYVIVNCFWGAENEPIVAALSRSAAVIVGVAATVLGFLIAGFSIFASMASKPLFKCLAQTPHEGTNLSELKYVFFNFINVFSVYLVLLVTSGAILFLAPLGPVTPLNDLIPVKPVLVIALNSAILALLLLVCVESALRLKSFIWSFYQSVLIAIILSPEDEEGSDTPTRAAEEGSQPRSADSDQIETRILTTTTH